MRHKCQAKECSLCSSQFLGCRHRNPDGWSPSVVGFLEEESGLNVGNSKVCVCDACHGSIRYAAKAKEKGEAYQLRE